MNAYPEDQEYSSEGKPVDAEQPNGADAFTEAVEQAYAEQEPQASDANDVAAKLAAEKDRVLRLQAEMENLRSRTAREVLDERRYGPLPLARDLLAVVDNMDRAIEAAEQTADAASLLEGFKLVRQQLVATLQQHHCQPIEAKGQPFDPQVHDAILQQPSDELPANHVLQETQVGYRLHDRVVRPSQVIISTGPTE